MQPQRTLQRAAAIPNTPAGLNTTLPAGVCLQCFHWDSNRGSAARRPKVQKLGKPRMLITLAKHAKSLGRCRWLPAGQGTAALRNTQCGYADLQLTADYLTSIGFHRLLACIFAWIKQYAM
jgi:hypothetical protein